jgi:hypothetical protein
MDIALRNSKIAGHLQKRFKERHGIELTRNRRMMLMNQIQNGMAKFLSQTNNGKMLYRVFLYSNATRANVNYAVLYCPKIKMILTVLPQQGSEEYKEFCHKNGLSLEAVRSRELTAQERTNESIKEYLKQKQERLVKREGLDRLKDYCRVKKYFDKKLDIH